MNTSETYGRNREKEIFGEALELEESERDAFVARACAGDSMLRTCVEELLRAYDEAAPERSVGERRGDRIGPYKLLQEIGEGGFGVVFMAEQEQPMRRKVALKILKPGMDTRQVIARFEAERQALAMMDHPNIARVLDAGATEGGRPYFVMELIKGVPITEYCDANDLITRERLELFIQVCQAVRHAHQKGIIHRDVKPSNVVVTLHDGEPVPKVIDFGIAKALGPRLTDKTLFTEFKQFLGTPEYMAPEQAATSGLDVDTRTDVYALGVLLYELLTGTTPLDAKKLRQAAYDELLRMIREEDPPRPSTRLSTMGARLSEVAKHRRVEPRSLARLVHGDLDWIVMRALEKDRTRRYDSAAALAADVERHIRDEPVLAGPPSAFYKLGKFARRHRLGFTAAGVVGAAILFGLAAATFGFLEAQSQRDNALRAEERTRAESSRVKRLNEFLLSILRAPIIPWFGSEETTLARAHGPDVRVIDVLDETASSLERTFVGEPELEADARTATGQSYVWMGRPADALVQLDRALALRQELYGEDDLRTLAVRGEIGSACNWLGRYDEGEANLRCCYEGTRRMAGDRDLRTLEAQRNLVKFLMDKEGRFVDAEPLARELVAACSEQAGEEAPATLSARVMLGFVLNRAEKFGEAEQILRETTATVRRVLGPRSSLLALCLMTLRDPFEAEKNHREALEIITSVEGLGYFVGTMCTFSLARVLSSQGRLAEAEQLLLDGTASARRNFGPDHPLTLGTMSALAFTVAEQGRAAEAEPLVEAAIETALRMLASDEREVRSVVRDLSLGLRAAGKLAEAESVSRAVVESCRRSDARGPGALAPDDLVRSLVIWAWALAALGRSSDADRALDEALAACAAQLDHEVYGMHQALRALAGALLGRKRFTDAEEVNRRLLDVLSRTLGARDALTLRAMNSLAWTLRQAERASEAEPLAREAVAGLRRIADPSWYASPHLLSHTLDTLGAILLDLDRAAEAEPLFAEIEELYASNPAAMLPVFSLRHGKCLLALRRFEEAEVKLLAAERGLADPEGSAQVVQTLVALYEAWEKPEQAAEWRAKLLAR